MLKVVKKANHTYTYMYITCMNFGDLKRILKVSAKITLTPNDEKSRLSSCCSPFLSSLLFQAN